MAYKSAHFKTALNQREEVLDAIVKEKLIVGALCTYNPANSELSGASDAATATHIIAQSDMSMEYGHIPVENRDYRYSADVAISTAAKKVAVFPIIDKTDIIVRA